MTRKKRKLELLSPAINADTAIQAILHGADAVYIGPPSHGARKAASNSIEEIERVVDFAHQYRAKVYATVNTIVYDHEVGRVEELCRDLYHAGVDALIVQDMALLRMNLPPIALHASTQCDIRTPEKAKFLEEVGFSQLVLARELTLQEIRRIAETVNIPIETFVHGALCVSFSGRCHASYSINGRSANRGECAQVCRYPFTLTDSNGTIIAKDKYLLSLKDFNAGHKLWELIEAGVSSFKIEGRLKDTGYVKNITALYNTQLNAIISKYPDDYKRSSYGDVALNFTPQAEKSFNRGFTDYFLASNRPKDIASLSTPKSQGEKIRSVSELNNGDGISFFDSEGNFTGVNINRVEGQKIYPARNIEIPKNIPLYRTFDVKWEKEMKGQTSQRKINVDIELNPHLISARDERGVMVALPLDIPYQQARQVMGYRQVFEKLGTTPYQLRNFTEEGVSQRFYRASELTSLRRRLIEELDKVNRITYPYEYRRKENKQAIYPTKELDYRDNVANLLAENFYKEHGVEVVEQSAETGNRLKEGDVVMTTRHCILRELGMCLRECDGKGASDEYSRKKEREAHKTKRTSESLRYPLYLNYSGGKFTLHFDCNRCLMEVKL